MYCTWKNKKCKKSRTIISTLKNRLYVPRVVSSYDREERSKRAAKEGQISDKEGHTYPKFFFTTEV